MQNRKFKFNKSAQYFVATILFVVLLALLQYFEKDVENSSIKTFFDAFWYSVVTLTTVGYGDYFPVSTPGKIVGLILIIFSLGVLSYLIGKITSKIQEIMEKKRLGQYGTDFNNHVIIVGWNDFGKLITDQIIEANQKAVVITDSKNDVEIIKELYKKHVFVVFGEINTKETLENANIDNCSSLLINIPDDSASLVYLINLRKNYKNINTVVYLSNTELKDTFYSAGATYVIPEKDITSKLVASFVFEPDVAKFTEDLITTAVSKDNYDMHQIVVNTDNPYLGKDYIDVFMALKKTFNAILIGISRKKAEGNDYILMKNPSNDMKIMAGDYLVIISDGFNKRKIESAFKANEGRMN